jgi:hypothetical protein
MACPRLGQVATRGRGMSMKRGDQMVDKRKDDAAPTADADARRYWLEEDAVAFAEQARWHELNPHPLEDILVDPRVGADP